MSSGKSNRFRGDAQSFSPLYGYQPQQHFYNPQHEYQYPYYSGNYPGTVGNVGNMINTVNGVAINPVAALHIPPPYYYPEYYQPNPYQPMHNYARYYENPSPPKKQPAKTESRLFPIYINTDKNDHSAMRASGVSETEKKLLLNDLQVQSVHIVASRKFPVVDFNEKLSLGDDIPVIVKEEEKISKQDNVNIKDDASSGLANDDKIRSEDSDKSTQINEEKPASPKPSPELLKSPKSPENTISDVVKSTSVSPPSASPSPNWASILKQTAPPIKKPIKSKSTSITANISNNSNFPDLNISSSPSQPLGILLLKVMFDPNYSVNNSNLPKFPIIPHGLLNTGNICYMNSILQILIFCSPFNTLFKLIHDKSTGSLKKDSETPLIDATIKFLQEFVKVDSNTENRSDKSYEDKKIITPDSFYLTLINHKKFQHLKWGQQEDAEEFLGYYLDGINEEFVNSIKKLSTSDIDSLIQNYSIILTDSDLLQKIKFDIKNTIKIIKNENSQSNMDDNSNDDNQWNEVGANNKKISINKPIESDPTPINQIFGGQFKSVLTIPKSSTSNSFQKSITVDPFQNIQLDITDIDKLEDAFVNLNHLELINYKSSNNQDLSIKKQTFIDKLPNVLIVHLKRFSFQKDKDRGIEKLRHKVEYSHELKIPTELLSSKAIETDYKLTGVVYHHGMSAAGGHYTCDVLIENDKANNWVRIDDTLLKQITDDEVLNGGNEEKVKNAYLLFYEKV